MKNNTAPSASNAALLVLVSGAPGSGKSTLARALADHLQLVHIERDAVFCSLGYTKGQPIDRKTVGIPAYYELLAWMLGRGYSVVTDGTLYPGVSEQDIRTKLMPIARVVNVHCHATGQRERFYAREMSRPGGKPEWLEGYMHHVEGVIENTRAPLPIGCELIDVETTGAYEPSIAELVARIGDGNNFSKEGYS